MAGAGGGQLWLGMSVSKSDLIFFFFFFIRITEVIVKQAFVSFHKGRTASDNPSRTVSLVN